MMYRTMALVALMALGATANTLAQSTPPANSTMTPSSSSSHQTPNNSSASKATPSQDPKMKSCMSAEKAKNSGLSDEQVKQKCMMQIASHQGEGK